jgi:ABC-type nitrate/sulfonate/bicarbonate transport system substrate-binding protein
MMFSRRNRSPKQTSLGWAVLVSVLALHSLAAAADKVRIGYTSPTPNHGVLWVADISNLFKKNNLDLEIVYMPGNISLPSLLSGEIQFAQMTGALMSPGRLQGADPVMLASVQDYLDDRLVARPTIKSIEDLKGKRVGISRFGAASHMRVLNFLPRFGLGEKDVTFLQIGDTPARVVALVGGSIDASSFSPPDHLAATKAGMKILFKYARVECCVSRNRAGHDAAPNRKKSRCREAHGESLCGSNPSRQDKP